MHSAQIIRTAAPEFVLPEPRSAKVATLQFRPYQKMVFEDAHSGTLVLHWSRQIGKSFTLAAWAVDRLLSRPGRLVTVLSNSRENGAEFLHKCGEVCALIKTIYELAGDAKTRPYEQLKLELRIRVQKRVSRIKVLAANPRTARGFSGDLILDEFAFHEDSQAIWEAAEPILSSNADYLCRIASTGNGRHNMFYRLATPLPGAELTPDGGTTSLAGFRLSRVTRTQACAQGQPVFDVNSRAEITPAAARAQALDKRAYDQNYECAFADEQLTLLANELISAAEDAETGFICEQEWSNAVVVPATNPVGCVEFLRGVKGPLYAGFDVARHSDLSVITVIEEWDGIFYVRAILRMREVRLPEQQNRLREICRLPRFKSVAIDMTGLGLGLFEFVEKEFGSRRIRGINFASTVPATNVIRAEGRGRQTVRVTEAMALQLLQAYESRAIRQPVDDALREDLRRPQRITSPGGRVSIAATRNEAGHADHFWSLALALEAAQNGPAPFASARLNLKANAFGRSGAM